ncbi:hypothetical protein E4U21_007769 [Claviceps maximensis]|nr:hypothetical protein E4U21_007769 [Claviceps maximensis]
MSMMASTYAAPMNDAGKNSVKPHVGDDAVWYFIADKRSVKPQTINDAESSPVDNKHSVKPHISDDAVWYFIADKREATNEVASPSV